MSVTTRKGLAANIYFATDDPEEAIAVANESGVRFLVFRVDPETGFPTIIFDARDNTDLPPPSVASNSDTPCK